MQTHAGYGSVLYHYINGELLPTTSPYKHHMYNDDGKEARVGEVEIYNAHGQVTAHTSESTVTLQVLSVAMGLYNGGVGPQSTKGLQSAKVNGVDVTNNSKWKHSWQVRQTKLCRC